MSGATAEQNQPDPQPDDEFLLRILDGHCEKLKQHFDSVQILGTRYNPVEGLTSHIVRGKGNYYARVGSAKAWIQKEDQSIRNESDGE